jgi:uncharacterized repeat protein (TIGR03943 family)
MLARIINCITLMGVGILFLAFYFSGRLEAYLHPQFRWCVLWGGISLIVCGIVLGWRKEIVEYDTIYRSAASKNLIKSLIAFGVLLLPPVFGSYFSKDSYDQIGILNRGLIKDARGLPIKSHLTDHPAIPSVALGGDIDETASAPALSTNQGSGTNDILLPEDTGEDITQDSNGLLDVEVTDLLSGQTQSKVRSMIDGKRIEVIGQYMPGSFVGGFNLVRMFIVCCAADARPITVQVKGKTDLSEMSWVKVIGRPFYAGSGKNKIVTLKAEKILSADPPADAMLY